MTTTTVSRSQMLRNARHYVVVNDGAYRWAGLRSEVYGWLSEHDFVRGFDAAHNTHNSVTMTVDAYQALCDGTTCYMDTSGSYCPANADPMELIDSLQDLGAAYLHIY